MQAKQFLLRIVSFLVFLLPFLSASAAPTEYWRYYQASNYAFSSAKQGVPYTYDDVVLNMQYYGYGLYAGYRCTSNEIKYNAGPSPIAPGTLSSVQTDGNGTAYAIPVHLWGCTMANTSPPQVISDRYSGQEPIALVVCRPGYSVSTAVYTGGGTSSCVPDASLAQGIDATNERGAAPNCDDCQKNFLRAAAAGSEPVGPVVGDPINAATGNEMLDEPDYQSAGGSLISFGRTYNSGAGFDFPSQGPGWTHTYAYRAIFADNGSTVVLQRPDGGSVTFTLSQGVYSAPGYEKGTLQVATTNSRVATIKYTRPDGTVEEYAGVGLYGGTLSKLTFAQGGALTFSYNGTDLTKVQDDRGHTLQVTYAYTAGFYRMSKVTLPDTTVVSYGYDAFGRLTTVTYPGSAVRTYQYLPATTANGDTSPLRFKLTRIVAENGNPVVNVAYDNLGRATASWAGTGNADLTTVSYGSNSATVTEPLGATAQMSFTSVDGTSRAFVTGNTRTCQNGCAGSGDSFEYDGRGNVSGLITKQGIKTCIAYSTPRNLPVLVVEGLPSGASCSDALAAAPSGTRVRTYQWHASYAVPMAITGPQQKVLFNYDTSGRMLLRAEVDTNDPTGAAGTGAQNVGTARTTTWTYNAKGSMTSVKAPRGDVNATTVFAYDSAENLVSVTDPAGLVTTYSSYDANGRPGLITAPNGLQTTLGYDARGRLTQVTAGGASTTYGYDAAGLLVSATLPTGALLTLGYDDANRMTWTQDSQGNRIDRILDAAGNVVQETVKGNGGALALSRQAAYDQLSRATSNTKAF